MPGRHTLPARQTIFFNPMTRQQVLDLYFLEARSKLLDIAAFLDRAERAAGGDDPRLAAFGSALGQLRGGSGRARRVLVCLSDRTLKPIEAAGDKGAWGAPRKHALH